MEITKETVKEAFEAHERVHPNWPVPEIISFWRYSERAFAEAADPVAMKKLYEGLIRWQVFRGSRSRPTSEEVHQLLASAVQRSPAVRTMRLSDLSPANLGQVGTVLDAVRNLKVNDDGPSLVAVSKFLHFLNPRLFVIVDRKFVGDFALQHNWIRQQVKATFDALPRKLQQDIPGSCLMSGRLRYLDILLWAGGVMRDNSHVADAFSSYVEKRKGNAVPPEDYRQYEGAAFEWFLLGLVELPPRGVKL